MQPRTPLLAMAALWAALGTAGAQVPSAPENFGSQDEAVTVLGPASFVPNRGSADTHLDLKWNTDGESLVAPLNTLPNGSVITRITYYFRDTDPATNLELAFCRTVIDAASGAPGFTLCYPETYPSGDSGDTYVVEPTSFLIQYRREDLDGDVELLDYFISVGTPAGNETTAIRAVEVRWKRRVSPAPAAASFIDVPTDDPAFQFVEALVASGITAGCGGSNYCPDAPLTRRQMAVFLAKALGLHWPWNAP